MPRRGETQTVPSRGESRNDYEKELRKRSPDFAERQRENRRNWYKQNPEKLREYEKLRRKRLSEDPDYKLRQKYKQVYKLYGLSQREYDQLVSAGCSICGSTKRPRVDHCHSTGKTRGILCHSCNIGLGFVERPDDWLIRAQSYLRDSQNKQ